MSVCVRCAGAWTRRAAAMLHSHPMDAVAHLGLKFACRVCVLFADVWISHAVMMEHATEDLSQHNATRLSMSACRPKRVLKSTVEGWARHAVLKNRRNQASEIHHAILLRRPASMAPAASVGRRATRAARTRAVRHAALTLNWGPSVHPAAYAWAVLPSPRHLQHLQHPNPRTRTVRPSGSLEGLFSAFADIPLCIPRHKWQSRRQAGSIFIM